MASRFKLLLVSLAIVTLNSVKADQPAQPFPTAPAGATAAPAYPPGNVSPLGKINIWDDKVFDIQKAPSPGSKSSKGSIRGTERYYADEADFNSEQRQQWIESCAPSEDKSKCFQDKRKANTENIKRQVSDVNARNSDPMRNMQNLPQGLGGSSFGGVDVDRE